MRRCDWCERPLPADKGGYIFVWRGDQRETLNDLFLCLNCDARRREARDEQEEEAK